MSWDVSRRTAFISNVLCVRGANRSLIYGSSSAQAYIDNLKATGQCEDGVICGLDGTAWTGGLALSAEEGAAIGETHSTCYSTPLRFCVGS